MSHRTFFSILGASVLLGACTDSTGPPEEVVLHHLRWAATETPRLFTVTHPFGYEPRDVGPGALGLSSPLEATDVSFWAVRGEKSAIRIGYQDDDDDDATFLTFTVPESSLLRRPDGTPFADGDRVLIGITIDTVEFIIHFEPTDLVFSDTDPAQLQISYAGADEDLNGDGVVDQEDDQIERELLGVWYQKLAADEWTGLGAIHSVDDDSFQVDLLHFSGYAVSW